MKVQEIQTEKGLRYILLDDNYQPVEEVNKYLRYLDAKGSSPNTIKNYAYHIKQFYEYMNAYNLDVLSVGRQISMNPVKIFTGFLEHLNGTPLPNQIQYRKERSNTTINTIMDTVLQFYDYLARAEILKELDIYKKARTNPKFKSFLSEMRHNNVIVKKSMFHKREVKKPHEYITRKQFEDLYNACDKRRDKLLVALLFEAGMRVSEALGIHLEDVEIEDGIIHIVARENNENKARVKNYSEGIVVIPDYVIDLLLEYITIDLVEHDSDFLFINLYGRGKGAPLKVITVEKLFERLSKNVGYHVHPHMLRHGFATEKKQFGWDIHDIAKYLRHRNVQSAGVYITITDDMKKEKIRKFLEAKREEFQEVHLD